MTPSLELEQGEKVGWQLSERFNLEVKCTEYQMLLVHMVNGLTRKGVQGKKVNKLICPLKTRVFRINFQNAAMAHTKFFFFFLMVLPHNKCRNNTITTIGVMYSFCCQRWSTSCLQTLIKGRLLWQLRLSSKSSSGMEHLHPLV